MIVPSVIKKDFKKPLVLIAGTFFLILYILYSLWFLYTPFRQRLLREYYTRLYPNIPQLEFAVKFKKINSSNDTISHRYNRAYIDNKTASSVIFPDGRTVNLYKGVVTALVNENVQQDYNSNKANNLSVESVGIDYANRKLAIINDSETKIFAVPNEAIIKKYSWTIVNGIPKGNFGDYSIIRFNDIKIGDRVIYQLSDPPVLTLLPPIE